MLWPALLFTACNGMFEGVYDEPKEESAVTASGQLYIDASDWTKWHYIDLKEVAEGAASDPDYNPSGAWVTLDIPLEKTADTAVPEQPGIYTYWYDVFGEGISKYEFRESYATEAQPEPKNWSIAVHRNNVRTNGGSAAATEFTSIDRLPSDPAYYESLDFKADQWNERDVWTIQEKMLLGLIGNQGIAVNEVLSGWLTINIPPMPPAFTHNPTVYVVKLADGSMGALQLQNYMNSTGKKCCLTINYKYPL